MIAAFAVCFAVIASAFILFENNDNEYDDGDSFLGSPGTYNAGDVAVINNLIANNGLGITPAPADGSSVPGDWSSPVKWTSDAMDKRIDTLYINSRGLTGEVDLTGLAGLRILDCYSNPLMTSLDVSGLTDLEYLDTNNSGLTSLNVSGCTIMWSLECVSNDLTSLDISGLTDLEYLKCNRNKLTALDISSNTSLKYLEAEYNKFTSLDFSTHTVLKTIHLKYNTLTSLKLNSAVSYLYVDVSGNQLIGHSAVTGNIFAWDGVDFIFSKQVATFTAVQAGGVMGTTDSTGITITFSTPVANLTANDITINSGTGTVTKGGLTGSGTTWTIALTDVAVAGSVTVIVADFDVFQVSPPSHSVIVHKVAAPPTSVTFTAAQTGASGTTDSTGIVLTFSAPVAGLTMDAISVLPSTGAVTVGGLTGSGTTWTISITEVTTQGYVVVKVVDFGEFHVTTGQQNVAVFTAYGSGGNGGGNGDDTDDGLPLMLIVAAVAIIGAVGAVAWFMFLRPKP